MDLLLVPERNSAGPTRYTIVAVAENEKQYHVTFSRKTDACTGILLRYYVPPTNRRCGYWAYRNLDVTSPRAKAVLAGLVSKVRSGR